MKPLIFLFALLAVPAAAWAQQNDPTPAPRYDRPRPTHRPPRDDTFFNTGPVLFKGIELQGGWLGGRGLEFNVPDGLEAESNGGVSIKTVRLKYDDHMDFESIKAGFTLDLNLFRLSLEGMKGRWQGEGTLIVDDGLSTLSVTGLALHGDFWGFKGGMYWPALRYRTGPFEACLGPEFTVGWYYQGLESVGASPVRLTDKQDEMVGGFGPRLSLRFIQSGWDISLDGQLPYLFGAIQGWAAEASLGIGLRF